MKNKILPIVLICLLTLILTACESPFSQTKKLKQDPLTAQPNELLSEMSQDAIRAEEKFVTAETILDDFIKSGRVMIKEFDKIHPQLQEDGRYDKSELGQMAREWRTALNFGGAHHDFGALIHQICHTPDDYYMFHQMNIDGQKGQRLLEHNIFFTKDFSKINMERYSKMIKGVFGVTISASDIKETVLIAEKELPTVEQGNQIDHIIYQENNIIIKVVALNDDIGDKYVAICSRYIPEQ